MTSQADQSELVARAGLIQLEADRLAYEASRPETSPERARTIRLELEVLAESMREIRREQLRGKIGLVTPRPMLPPRRRRWPWSRRG